MYTFESWSKYSIGEYPGTAVALYITIIILPLKHFLIIIDIYVFVQWLCFEHFTLYSIKCWAVAMMEIGTTLCRMIRDGLWVDKHS